MKYSLRSLMIGLTLFCVAMGGRIEYLRRWAVYHEGLIDKFGDYHRMKADLYRQAMLRPWTIVGDPDAEQYRELELQAEREADLQERESHRLLNSQAPAPNPPKK